MIFTIIKRMVYALCILYSLNIIIIKKGKIIPINMYTILIVTIFDVLGIISIIYLKYYC